MQDGEPCGDAAGHWCPAAAEGGAPRHLLAIVDGLGHGPLAAEAAQAAIDTLAAQPGLPLAELMARLDERLARTRGAAVGLVQIDGARLLHAGIGNTRVMRLRGAAVTRLPSQNGIVGGGQCARSSLNELEVQPGDWLVLYTDGIDEMLNLPLQLPEWQRDPDTLCQHVLARWRLGADDAGVLVALATPAAPEVGR